MYYRTGHERMIGQKIIPIIVGINKYPQLLRKFKIYSFTSVDSMRYVGVNNKTMSY